MALLLWLDTKPASTVHIILVPLPKADISIIRQISLSATVPGTKFDINLSYMACKRSLKINWSSAPTSYSYFQCAWMTANVLEVADQHTPITHCRAATKVLTNVVPVATVALSVSSFMLRSKVGFPFREFPGVPSAAEFGLAGKDVD